jgi:hypothetical protein
MIFMNKESMLWNQEKRLSNGEVRIGHWSMCVCNLPHISVTMWWKEYVWAGWMVPKQVFFVHDSHEQRIHTLEAIKKVE